MKIIFWGTPEFAIPSLERLIGSHHELLAVVTGPDKPVGRGLKLSPTPVKQVAQQHGLPVLTPEKLSDPAFITELKKFPAELYVVVAFRILPVAVFTIPARGAINLHASLLPKYRGAAPINWVIINGEKETGVTTFFIEEKVDTGAWILQQKVSIGDDETAGELHDRLSQIGAEVLLETVNLIELGNPPRIPQQGEVTRAPKITREVCQIDWTKDATTIFNLIRGLSPFPRAFSFLQGQEIKICGSKIQSLTTTTPNRPGEIVALTKETIAVATGQGVLGITEIQPESKRRMSVAEFLRGNAVNVGDRLR
ncbi:MAG: methionyl-tRNA formyltransferase [candidate division KSB1 bacterium]|nr:methionyl-tRNA formyltransferase [candidate division KSB1 bacterium]MDZ7341838.1 methionyl-tRNA formyltransferase [candidate division KSB1 bacterium]